MALASEDVVEIQHATAVSAGVAIEGIGYGGVCRLQPRAMETPMTESSMPDDNIMSATAFHARGAGRRAVNRPTDQQT